MQTAGPLSATAFSPFNRLDQEACLGHCLGIFRSRLGTRDNLPADAQTRDAVADPQRADHDGKIGIAMPVDQTDDTAVRATRDAFDAPAYPGGDLLGSSRYGSGRSYGSKN
jgi:hypothetical protein